MNAHLSNESAPGQKLNPWLFVPLLYFMQAIPVTLVQEVSSIVFKDAGIDNAEITKWTSLIALPWSLQMFLGPLVDLNMTKRRWILLMQLCIMVGLIGFAYFGYREQFFTLSVVLLLVTGICSALCNVATDGFYVLTMPDKQRAQFVGVQSTCYRLGRLFCSGLIVYVVGRLQVTNPELPAWTIVIGAALGLYAAGRGILGGTLPKEPTRESVENSAREQKSVGLDSIRSTLFLLTGAVGGYFALSGLVKLSAHLLYTMLDGKIDQAGLDGWKLPESSTILNVITGNSLMLEASQIGICGALSVLCITNLFRTLRGTEMGEAFTAFVKQQGFPAILGFIFFYRFGEAMVGKISSLFILDSTDKGGLGFSIENAGLITGTIGVLGIVLGGISGGLFVSKFGLRKAFWPLVLAMHIPNLMYIYAAREQPGVFIFGGISFIDQFGYGFGFAGYMVYLMWVARRSRFETAHFAIGTGMGALTIATAGVLSGVIQSNFGYQNLFITVIFLMIPGSLILRYLPLDQTEGRGIQPVDTD